MNHFSLAVAVLLAGTSLVVSARPAILPPLSPEIGKEYVHSHTLVDVGSGRKMNLYCRGAGSITVIFDAGLSDWSSIWALVQPAVASSTRACTYDRADIAAERQVIQVRSAYQAAQLSEWTNCVYQQPANTALDATYAKAFAPEVFGDMPLVVLSHSIDEPDEAYAAMLNFKRQRLHEQTAALSTHGVHRVVPETHHNIEVEQPQAIIDAIEDVLQAASN